MNPAWQFDAAFVERVTADMRGEVDMELREGYVCPKWRATLVALLSDSNMQLAQRRAEIARVEIFYALNHSDATYNKLQAERARYVEWKRANFSYHRALLRRLHEANLLLDGYEEEARKHREEDI